MSEKGRVLTGARARFSIDGVKVGYARNVTIGESVNFENLECLDNIEVEEIVPIGYVVDTFTASMFRLVGESVKKLGYFPKNGANAEEHLSNILTAGVMVATVEDTKTGTLVATAERVRMASRNWSIDARGVVAEDVTFACIRIKDESEV